jgi:hypothetical protein
VRSLWCLPLLFFAACTVASGDTLGLEESLPDPPAPDTSVMVMSCEPGWTAGDPACAPDEIQEVRGQCGRCTPKGLCLSPWIPSTVEATCEKPWIERRDGSCKRCPPSGF